MRRARVLCVITVLVLSAAAVPAADEPFVALFGGFADNDAKTGADESTPWGFRLGQETPVAGGQIAVTFNRDGNVKMDTLMGQLLLNFGSFDARTRRNRILYNRVSGFGILGAGTMRYDDGTGRGPAWIFAYSLGLGMQVKFTQKWGMRVQVERVRTGRNNFRGFTGDVAVAFYF